ncbi:MAG: hypothetical protein JWO51_3930 [Rhodospirillales bacterium]|nr:hypothetical protein [Rhodospirillales bacterium]
MLSPRPPVQKHRSGMRPILGAVVSLSLLVGAEAKAVVAESPHGEHVALIGKINFADLAKGTTVKPPLPDAAPLAGKGVLLPEAREIPFLKRLQASKLSSNSLPSTTDLLTPIVPNQLVVGLPFTGFTGLTHFDQRTTDGGNQFSLEPPDQALAVGGGYVLEAVNNAIAIYDTHGNQLAPTLSINRFFNEGSEINRATGVRSSAQFSDPRAYYDSASKRWFVFEWATLNMPDGTPLNLSAQFFAVSETSNPLGNWFLYDFDTTNSDVAGCPCLPDFQRIGFDADGVYVAHNMFQLTGAGNYVMATIYALSKQRLEAGAGSPFVRFTLPNDFTVDPTVSPPGAVPARFENGTEYLVEDLANLSANGSANKVRVFALSNTKSLSTATPRLYLGSVDTTTQSYSAPPPAVQPDGPRPYAASLVRAGAPLPPVPHLDGGDTRFSALPVFVNNQIWAALNTSVPNPAGGTKVGVAYFSFEMLGGAHGFVASLHRQGLITAPAGTSVLYPAIAMPVSGSGGIGVTVVGPGLYPSTGFVTVKGAAVSGIQIAGIGALPDDGFTGYNTAHPYTQGTGRWGDYGAAAVDENGDLWFANEYIPDTASFPRTTLANWGTFITHYHPTAAQAVATR